MKFMLVISYFLLLHCVVADEERWCPPKAFKENFKKRTSSLRTAVITEIHGQIHGTDSDWGYFLEGNLLSRFIFQYIGILGFDKVYLNVNYNGTLHKTPPTVAEIYPTHLSCVSEWINAGVIEWNPFPYGGPKSDWPVDPLTNQPSLTKDLYKTLRGINPVFEKIKKNKEADWVLVADSDEYLVSVGFHPNISTWCQYNQPTLISTILGQMLTTAATRTLNSYEDMYAQRQTKVKVPCPVGRSIAENKKCQDITAISFPVHFWTQYPKDAQRTDLMPLLRSRLPLAYDYELIENRNKTLEEATQHQEWKTIHRMSLSPLLTGTRTMHHGSGFSILAPRKYHGSLSFELAHVKKLCVDNCESVVKRDNRMHGLYMSYSKCMRTIAGGGK